MADHLNTIFQEELVLTRIDHFEDKLAPLMQEHIVRWGLPGSMEEWYDNIDVMREFARQRPQHVRENFVDYFDLNGTVGIELNTNYTKGNLFINSVDTSQFKSGPPENGTWQGQYFINIPISVTAEPKPGYVFLGWEEADGSNSLSIVPTEDMTLTAVFERQ